MQTSTSICILPNAKARESAPAFLSFAPSLLASGMETAYDKGFVYFVLCNISRA